MGCTKSLFRCRTVPMFAFARAALIGRRTPSIQNEDMDRPKEIAPHVAHLRVSIANVYFVGNRESWVLVDTGVPGYSERIRKAAEARFGEDSKPHAIVLTHGHFDHAAGALELARY